MLDNATGLCFPEPSITTDVPSGRLKRPQPGPLLWCPGGSPAGILTYGLLTWGYAEDVPRPVTIPSGDGLLRWSSPHPTCASRGGGHRKSGRTARALQAAAHLPAQTSTPRVAARDHASAASPTPNIGMPLTGSRLRCAMDQEGPFKSFLVGLVPFGLSWAHRAPLLLHHLETGERAPRGKVSPVRGVPMLEPGSPSGTF